MGLEIPQWRHHGGVSCGRLGPLKSNMPLCCMKKFVLRVNKWSTLIQALLWPTIHLNSPQVVVPYGGGLGPLKTTNKRLNFGLFLRTLSRNSDFNLTRKRLSFVEKVTQLNITEINQCCAASWEDSTVVWGRSFVHMNKKNNIHHASPKKLLSMPVLGDRLLPFRPKPTREGGGAVSSPQQCVSPL